MLQGMFGNVPQRGFNQPQKKQQPIKNSDNFVEAVKDIGSDVVKKTASDLVGGIAKNTIDTIFGKTQQTLEPNQTLDLQSLMGNQAQKETPKATVETFFKPFSNPLERKENIISSQAEIAITREIEQVRAELKMLIAAAKELSNEAEKAVSQRPVNPGVYHLNFFERLKLIIKLARQQIQESNTWLSMMQSKKAQKGYWQMFKKHGTSFAMSSERALASSMG